MLTDKIASTHLGKKSEGSFNYNPSLLVAVPRKENRRQYDINSNNLPFLGVMYGTLMNFLVLQKVVCLLRGF